MKTLKFKEYKRLNEDLSKDEFDPRYWKDKKLRLDDQMEEIQDKITDFIYDITENSITNRTFKDRVEIISYDPLVINYTCNEFNVQGRNIYSFAHFPVQINKIKGDLNVTHTRISNFDGFPKEVTGDFRLNGNNFKTLRGIDNIKFSKYSTISISELGISSVDGFSSEMKFKQLKINTPQLLTLAGFESRVMDNIWMLEEFGRGQHLLSFAVKDNTKLVLSKSKILILTELTNKFVRCIYQLPEDELEIHYRFLEKHFEVESLDLLDKAIEYSGRVTSFKPDPVVSNLRKSKGRAEKDIGFSF